MREITFDTETTGLDPKSGHRIVEVGCVELIDMVKTGKIFHAYINPQRDMPKEAEKIHGLSIEFLSNKPLFKDIADEFLDFVRGDRLVIHNAAFDMKFINFELESIKKKIIPFEQATDTLSIVRKKFPGAKASLDALCQKFGISLERRDKHGALLDADLLADVYIELMGGRQDMMSFGISKNNSNNIIPIKSGKRRYIPPREYTLSEEEIIAHQEFVKKIKNSLWGNF